MFLKMWSVDHVCPEPLEFVTRVSPGPHPDLPNQTLWGRALDSPLELSGDFRHTQELKEYCIEFWCSLLIWRIWKLHRKV